MMRSPHAVTVALVLVLTGAFVWYALSPGASRLKVARADLRAKLQDIQAENERLADLERLDTEVAALRRRTQDFETRIPDEHGLGEFLRDLATILESNGLEKYTFQPRPAYPVLPEQLPNALHDVAAALRVQPVVVQFEGDFESLYAGLRMLEELPRLSHVETMKLSGDAERPGRIKVEMTLRTFFRATRGDI
ncbi:MAG: type 4a pilus biogenesis protein PilO [Phycisphaerae bacterium]